MSRQISSEDLRKAVRATGLSLRELSLEIKYSTTTLSLWLRGQYPNDSADLETAIAQWVSAVALSARDRRKFAYISDLLDNAEDKQAIIDTILRASIEATQTNRSSS
jgi:transcriptional regulator with XRE-family HTH domain